MNYKKIVIGAVAYFFSSFVIQGMLGFMLGGEYFLSIPVLRESPILYLALSQAFISGIAFATLYPFTNFVGAPIVRGLKYGLLIGLIIIPFVALDLPARFTIPMFGTWIWIQALLGMLHHAVAGILVGLIYGREAE